MSVKYSDWDDAETAKLRAERAKATFRKDRRLNIRLSSKDLEAIQKRALAEGLPYQTLISSALHKYASGRLKEVYGLAASVARASSVARRFHGVHAHSVGDCSVNRHRWAATADFCSK